ncbi:MAG: aminotransferase class V-fold PLP-dependent enzyme [Bacillota bacterium]|nr:aminotransferase class V-fold PLP-dependent enzyme [Bacillota bacterium]
MRIVPPAGRPRQRPLPGPWRSAHEAGEYVYLDHAATSYPKPPEVIAAMVEYMRCSGGNPGRSGHRLSIAAAMVIHETREAVATLFGAPDPLRVVFTPNVTYAVNLILKGLLRPGDRVVTSSMEHNAVMRPLRALERRGVKLTVVPCDRRGCLDPAGFRCALAGGARLAVVNHASNVTGTILPLAELSQAAHAAGALLLADVAQTGGVCPVDMQALGVDILAFTGHKGLLGAPGTGGLILGPRVDPESIEPLVCGGTGSQSELEEQPDYLPDRFESGTANGVGLAGLRAGVSYVLRQGVQNIRAHERELTWLLLDGLARIPGVTVHGPQDPDKSVAVVSFSVPAMPAGEVGTQLEEDFGLLCRTGLHCAPAAHKTIGTLPGGTVRMSLGLTNTEADVERAIEAVAEVARR